MANEYFNPGTTPAPNSPGSSLVMRGKFASIAEAFDKLPIMGGNSGEILAVNGSGTALVASGVLVSSLVVLSGPGTFTGKTFGWSDNTWVGFGTGATKDAGTSPGDVLLLGPSGAVEIANGGTGATNLAGAQAALGIDQKANIHNAALTGAPTVPTPPASDNSARIANTAYVNQVVTDLGSMVPSSLNPLMNGAVSPGTSPQASRYDHVHPVDTSRAPASAATAAGTSLTPTGTVAATNVQSAIAELDTEKAPLASPAFTGAPTAPTPATSVNTTQVATTAFVQSLLAEQPSAGIQASDSTPLMNGVAAPGVGVDGSRYDHVHPVDTSRAPASAATAAGTSFSPTGAVAATNVQSAIAELDTEKAPLASPALTGTPVAPTAAVGTSTTQLATTAFVNAEIANDRPFEATATNIKMNGTQAVGALGTVARGDHVHPVDTSRAPIASPTFTGTPAAPTASVGTSTTQLATTAFVNAEIANDRPFEATATNIKMNGVQGVGTLDTVARGDHVHPVDTSRAPVANPAFTGMARSNNSRPSAVWSDAQFMAYTNTGATYDFASMVFYVQDVANAPQCGFNATDGSRLGFYGSDGTTRLFTFPVAGLSNGILKIASGDVAPAVADTDYATPGYVTTAVAGKQNLDATLTALAGLSTSANQMIYATGADSFAMTGLSAFARTLLDDSDAATARATLGIGSFSDIQLGTAVTPGAVTAVDFTSIPAWANRITINLANISFNASSDYLVLLGDAEGFETSGYTGSNASSGGTDVNSVGFHVARSAAASQATSGRIVIEKINSTTWAMSSVLAGGASGETRYGAGAKSLSGTLDKVRLTTLAGTATIDGGTINISWE